MSGILLQTVSPQFRVPAKFDDYVEAIDEDPDLMKLVGESYLSGSYKDLRRLGARPFCIGLGILTSPS